MADLLFDQQFLTTVLLSGIVAGVPLLYASLGEIVAEQSGVLNVGLEGMMLVGALRRVRGHPRDREPVARPHHRRDRRSAHVLDHGDLLHPPGHGPDRGRHRHRAHRRRSHEPAAHDLVLADVPAGPRGRRLRDPGPVRHPRRRAERLQPTAAGLLRRRPRVRGELDPATNVHRPEPACRGRAARFARCGRRQRGADPQRRRARRGHAGRRRRRVPGDRCRWQRSCRS